MPRCEAFSSPSIRLTRRVQVLLHGDVLDQRPVLLPDRVPVGPVELARRRSCRTGSRQLWSNISWNSSSWRTVILAVKLTVAGSAGCRRTSCPAARHGADRPAAVQEVDASPPLASTGSAAGLTPPVVSRVTLPPSVAGDPQVVGRAGRGRRPCCPFGEMQHLRRPAGRRGSTRRWMSSQSMSPGRDAAPRPRRPAPGFCRSRTWTFSPPRRWLQEASLPPAPAHVGVVGGVPGDVHRRLRPVGRHDVQLAGERPVRPDVDHPLAVRRPVVVEHLRRVDQHLGVGPVRLHRPQLARPDEGDPLAVRGEAGARPPARACWSAAFVLNLVASVRSVVSGSSDSSRYRSS